MHRILVLDANQRSSLAVIRSLGRHEIEVVVADSQPCSMGATSRYAVAQFQYTDPGESADAFRNDVFSKARELAIDMIMPITDLSTMLLVGQESQASPMRIACPSLSSYEALSDKGKLIELALRVGVPVPRTVVARTADEIREAALRLGFPLVLKPSRSRYLKDGRVVSTAVLIAQHSDALEEKIAALTWLQDLPCLVQEFIPGTGAGIFALGSNGTPIAWFAHRRLREKPPSGGVSVLSESVGVDSHMRELAERLLRESQWTGVAMIEFRVSPDGTPYLMEVNGRFWGSLQLAIDSGVDFPWMLSLLIAGQPVEHRPAYKIGGRLRWLFGDVDNLLLQLRARGAGIRPKLAAVGDFVTAFFDLSARQEIFRWSDPRPAWHELRTWIARLGK